VIKGLYLF